MHHCCAIVASTVLALISSPGDVVETAAAPRGASVRMPAQLRCDGLLGAVGDADVLDRLSEDPSLKVTVVEPCSPGGQPGFETNASAASSFVVDRTFTRVVPGRETECAEVDAALAALRVMDDSQGPEHPVWLLSGTSVTVR